ncbi:MAG: TIGR00295 family protein [Candidatus Bathyarchaeota archaeon]|nr:TIGR00295 family protein [Candidatus Bathyarchaeota archaeon]
MSNPLPSREQALQLLRETRCAPAVIRHCEAVAEVALKTAKVLKEKGFKVDSNLVEIGALLHDIGRAKTHTVHHAVVGAEIAEAAGLPDAVISIIKRHVGGGITAEEAEKFGWPKDVYVPMTLEEKIVSYADKLIEGTKQAPVEVTVRKLVEEHKEDAAERVQRLHEEICHLLGDDL